MLYLATPWQQANERMTSKNEDCYSTLPENVKDLIESVIDNRSKIGLAFDGDADRLGVISPKGKMIYPDMQMILFTIMKVICISLKEQSNGFKKRRN